VKAVSGRGDRDGAWTVDRVQTVNFKTTVGTSRTGADRFQGARTGTAAEMKGFHTISFHVRQFLTNPALKGREGGAVRPRVYAYRDHVYRQLF